MYLTDDLQKRLNFIDETYQYNDYKPFFTDMWDAIILAGKHALLRFELFQSLQRTELDGNSGKILDEKVLKDLLDDVRQSINRSLSKLNETEEIKNSLEEHKIGQRTINVSSINTANIAKGIINQAKEELA